MLSNTEEMNPRPNVLGQDAGGSLSTGIMDAQVTSARRKRLPLNASGIRLHWGLRHGAQASSTTQTATPIAGKFPMKFLKWRFTATLVPTAAISIAATMATRAQSIGGWRPSALTI